MVFLTNPLEEEYLHSEIGQDYIASAIFRAFRSYKNDIEKNEKNQKKKIKKLVYSNEKDKVEKNILSTNVAENNISSSKIIYKVQIGTYLKSMLNIPQFQEINAVEEKINGTFKYFVNSGSEKSAADMLKNNLVDLGFNGAFIVAFLKGERISTKEALNLQNK